MKTMIALAALALAAPMFAQDLRTATLVGTISDSSGAAVSGANISATNIDTNVVTRTKSNADGAYYVPFLIAGAPIEPVMGVAITDGSQQFAVGVDRRIGQRGDILVGAVADHEGDALVSQGRIAADEKCGD